MAWLTLNPGFKLKVGMVFETADDDVIAMTASHEARVSAMEDNEGAVPSNADMDRIADLKTVAFAQVSFIARSRAAPTQSHLLTADELRRHIAEATAVLKSMDASASLVDRHMGVYRAGVRKAVEAADGGGHDQ